MTGASAIDFGSDSFVLPVSAMDARNGSRVPLYILYDTSGMEPLAMPGDRMPDRVGAASPGMSSGVGREHVPQPSPEAVHRFEKAMDACPAQCDTAVPRHPVRGEQTLGRNALAAFASVSKSVQNCVEDVFPYLGEEAIVRDGAQAEDAHGAESAIKQRMPSKDAAVSLPHIVEEGRAAPDKQMASLPGNAISNDVVRVSVPRASIPNPLFQVPRAETSSSEVFAPASVATPPTAQTKEIPVAVEVPVKPDTARVISAIPREENASKEVPAPVALPTPSTVQTHEIPAAVEVPVKPEAVRVIPAILHEEIASKEVLAPVAVSIQPTVQAHEIPVAVEAPVKPEAACVIPAIPREENASKEVPAPVKLSTPPTAQTHEIPVAVEAPVKPEAAHVIPAVQRDENASKGVPAPVAVSIQPTVQAHEIPVAVEAPVKPEAARVIPAVPHEEIAAKEVPAPVAVSIQPTVQAHEIPVAVEAPVKPEAARVIPAVPHEEIAAKEVPALVAVSIQPTVQAHEIPVAVEAPVKPEAARVIPAVPHEEIAAKEVPAPVAVSIQPTVQAQEIPVAVEAPVKPEAVRVIPAVPHEEIATKEVPAPVAVPVQPTVQTQEIPVALEAPVKPEAARVIPAVSREEISPKEVPAPVAVPYPAGLQMQTEDVSGRKQIIPHAVDHAVPAAFAVNDFVPQSANESIPAVSQVMPKADVPQVDSKWNGVVHEAGDHLAGQRQVAAPVKSDAKLDAPVPYVAKQNVDDEQLKTAARQIVAELPQNATHNVAAVSQNLKAAADIVVASARTQSIANSVNEAVESIVGQLLVSRALEHGDGEMLIRLKPDVLDGSEIRLVAASGELSVQILPATPDAALLIGQGLTRLQEAIAAHAPRFHRVDVSVQSGAKREERK